ncbi:Homeobox protein prospero [Armadillidium vulgare]|nr:Homeobox protein prospero [Armadillidium vulgare]
MLRLITMTSLDILHRLKGKGHSESRSFSSDVRESFSGIKTRGPSGFGGEGGSNTKGAPDESNGLVGGLRRDVGPPYWPPISLAPPNPHSGPMGLLPGPMAQDEEGEFILGEKLLKKPKRIRTRVDAGEPRNPYSAFGSFPNLCGVSVNSARTNSVPNSLFSGNPAAFCGLPFVNYLNPQNNIGARGMLSELFGGGPTKSMVSCSPEDRTMGVLDKVNSNNVHSNDSINSVIRGPEAENVLLREILQGRKRDLITMEDIEAARSLHNNNISFKSERSNSEREEVPSRDGGRNTNSANALTISEDEAKCDSDVEDVMSPSRPASPSSDCDPKKNRLENIVSVIRSSPTPPTPVNGCKKRKLYLPQQHEARTQIESPEERSESPAEPETKSRRVDEDPSSPSRQENTAEDDRGLQIDLSIRNDDRIRRSPGRGTPRSTSPKPPTTSSTNDSAEPSAYLLDYAKHLFRSQSLQRESDSKSSDLSEKLNLLRSFSLNSQVTELIEGLADVLKTEITASLAVIIDSIVNKYVQQRKMLTKQAEAAAEQLNRDIASQLIERSRSPRPNNILNNSNNNNNNITSNGNNNNNSSKERSTSNQIPRINGLPPSHGALNLAPYGPSENNLNSLNLPHLRPQLYKSAHGFFQGTLPTTGSSVVPLGQTSPYASLPAEPEQDEALSLVVTPKKKRHKVTDSRLTPRTVGRLLEDLPRYSHMAPLGGGSISPRGSPPPHSLIHHQAPPRPSFPQPPPPLLPVSLPTSVAIPNPSLHDNSLLYPTYYRGTTSPSEPRREESPASHHPPHHHPLLHPALLAASSPDSFSHFLRGADHDRTSDCSPQDNHYDGVQPAISFYGER